MRALLRAWSPGSGGLQGSHSPVHGSSPQTWLLGKMGEGGREEKPAQVWAWGGQLCQDPLTQKAGAQVDKPCCPCPGLRSTVFVSEEGNRKESILDLEHKKSPGETERKRGPGPREPGLPERLRMDQDTSGPCLLFQAQRCDKQGAGSPKGSGRGGMGRAGKRRDFFQLKKKYRLVLHLYLPV